MSPGPISRAAASAGSPVDSPAGGPAGGGAIGRAADGKVLSGRAAACPTRALQKTLTGREAVSRLGELGLSIEMVERVVRRADAEASTCTPLDPPVMEGLLRWGRTSRYLREELVPLGWAFDNPRLLARTIHPSGAFAIVAATGDELTGLADLLPSTKYAKGTATIDAVAANEQLTLFDLAVATTDVATTDVAKTDVAKTDVAKTDEGDPSSELLTWFLLFHADADAFRVELSLPDGIVDGRITSWAERIILPEFPRDDDRLELEPAQDERIFVEVNRRQIR